ncbi:histidinol-phosphate aminotransferase family protein [Meiothermus sp. PNK-Is4]|uniref:pyridoxal phosphate-dependent aminotransferase n=1 Tax=Meiothermus sp. PNK-Is4 TaxID=2740565 RepID=UPI0010223F6F|nr:aminotransferase class I/II-fold pyridoxal phosphate-dependent enzyme [Meiothermus sp. PNK-Is4]RYM36446.1 histidinol-phosphate aminotransferase family protein [Meiothermus sp. PNK-Is4]
MIDDVLRPIHGGPDGGPEPRYDFSTNANALGPDPFALEAIRAADPSRYPDPLYTRLHAELAAHHGVGEGQVAVGSGSSELIHRLVRWRWLRGPMLILPPTFSEYARAAQPAELPLLQAQSPREFLELLPRATLAFLCVPNNPTGVRAAYLLAPHDLAHFRNLAPSWVLSVHGEAFLRAAIQPASQGWLEATRQTLWRWRAELAEGLRALGLEVREGAANFLMVRVGQATAVARALRLRGVRVRDCTSFGLPEWLRLSAQAPEARQALLEGLREVLDG